jgi:hypothetical protein
MITFSILLEKMSPKIKKIFTDKPKRSLGDANKLATHRSNVNEYVLASELAGRAGLKDTRPGDNEEERAANEEMYNRSKQMIDPEEYEDQKQRSIRMADQSINQYKRKGIDLTKAKSVHISSGKGAIKRITGLDINSEDHPPDVMLKVPHKKFGTIFPGISAKSNKESTEGKGTERISNRGLQETAEGFGKKWHTEAYDKLTEFAEKKGIGHLPLSSEKGEGGRKEWLRRKGNESHLNDAKIEGGKVLSGVRDSYMNELKNMASDPNNKENQEKIRKHLLEHHFRAGEKNKDERVPYIITSGYGTKKTGYGAHSHESDEGSPHVDLLKSAHHFTFEPSGENGFSVYAHKDENDTLGHHLLNVSAKFNSQAMASSIKLVGTEGTLKPKKIKKQV